MPRVEFEPTTPVFERAKGDHASALPAAVVGVNHLAWYNLTLYSAATNSVAK
jgi:hypothetical protein